MILIVVISVLLLSLTHYIVFVTGQISGAQEFHNLLMELENDKRPLEGDEEAGSYLRKWSKDPDSEDGWGSWRKLS